MKRIVGDRARDEEFRALFVNEAKLAARLHNANVVSVHDYGHAEDGSSFLIMELVEGKELAAVTREAHRRQRPLPVPLALYVIAEALQGLHYAHEFRNQRGQAMGIIHRDISPHNLLISWFGEVKVADFGIAKVRAASGESSKVLRGKVAYM